MLEDMTFTNCNRRRPCLAEAPPKRSDGCLHSPFPTGDGTMTAYYDGRRNPRDDSGRNDNRSQPQTVTEIVPAALDPVTQIVQSSVGQSADWSDAPIVLSFFTGAMGLDLGLEAAGFAVRLASEIDPDARETIQINRPGIPVLGNIHQYTATQVRAAAGVGDEDLTMVVGGPPCQTFSSAGKRKALDDVRGIAILKFVSLALELHPQYIVIENVRGLLSAEGGSVFEKVPAMLKAGGYAVSFDLYNSAYFGSPQQRERMIVIANRHGRVPYLTPTNSDRPEDGLPRWKTLGDAIGDMQAMEHHFVQFPDRRLDYFKQLTAGQNWRDLPEEDQKAALSEATLDAPGGKSGFYRRLGWDRPCPTLVAPPNMPATDLCHPEKLRPLSIQEYKRIQGFPDDWELCGDLVAQYRQIGNAVPVPLGKAVGLAIREHMRTHRSEDPVPGFRYSRYSGTSDRDWCGVDAARARLAEIAPKIRRMGKRTRKSLLVTARNALPRAKRAGRLLMAAKTLCRKCRLPWEPWIKENCEMSDRRRRRTCVSPAIGTISKKRRALRFRASRPCWTSWPDRNRAGTAALGPRNRRQTASRKPERTAYLVQLPNCRRPVIRKSIPRSRSPMSRKHQRSRTTTATNAARLPRTSSTNSRRQGAISTTWRPSLRSRDGPGSSATYFILR